MHQSFGILHKRLQHEDLLVREKTRGLRPTEKNRTKFHTRKCSGAPPETQKKNTQQKLLFSRSGAPPVAGDRATHMIRWRLRRPAGKILRRNHLNLLRRRVRRSALKGSHRLRRRRRRDFRLPHHLPSTIAGGVVVRVPAQGQISTS